ncbi:nuclear transport factor 2 family protein [Variovorax sp. M-6]|uniref:nuclear transport factor 2 family protein n=1 Tax=Variovorax sp. M-6 TaxID=3233041 RepID=UPI003F990CFE
MQTASKTLIGLETRFWQSIVDNDANVAIDLLTEPAMMVSSHGAMKFDHAGYRKMAEQGSMVVRSFEIKEVEVVFPTDTTAVLSYRVRQGISPRGKKDVVTEDMNDTSTWVRDGEKWRCAMHTETPVAQTTAH